jgi:hypothetical protein
MTSDNEIRHDAERSTTMSGRQILCVRAPRCKRTLYFPEELQSARGNAARSRVHSDRRDVTPAYDVRFVLTRIKAGLRVGAKIGRRAIAAAPLPR